MRSKDSEALEETYDQYALKLLDRTPYPTIKGVETILEDMAKGNPKVKGVDAKSFVDPHFIKELEDSGYIGKLYGGKK